ncbi:MAG: zinc ribbon domain-containing protein [Anaerolineales bacterium]|nr:zinc ribbon domain-containing protein [Anaerolineales bacterium]
MSDQPAQDLRCANCGQQLDPRDKFCRECGLPTLRHLAERKPVHLELPDTVELKRALEATPEPKPFLRVEPAPGETDDPYLPTTSPPETTGDILHGTSPTQMTRLAGSTLIMIGLIMVLVIAGVVLLILAISR